MIEIPVFSEIYSFTEEIQLDDIAYVFQFDWNYRCQSWNMSIYDLESNPIVAGIRVVVGQELIRKYNHLAIPQGAIYAFDSAKPFERIEIHELGERVKLLYLTDEEYAAL